MPSKFRLRYIFKPLVITIAKGLNKIKVTANMATFMMLGFSVLAFISLIPFNNLILFGVFVFLTGLFDGVDGALARLTQTDSEFGGFFDSTMDRISEFVIFLGLLLYYWDAYLWTLIDMKLIIFIAFTANIMISYSRARAEPIYKGDYDIGLMARSERLFYLFITSIIAFFIGSFDIFLFIYMWLVILTFLYRGIKIKAQIEKYQNEKNQEKDNTGMS